MTVNKKLFNISWLVLVLWMGLAGLGVNAQTTLQSVYPAGAGIRVKEVDGSPNVVGVQTLVFPNGTLTRSGRTVTVTVGTTINSTNGQLPYRVNSTTFGDSAIASNALNSTYLSVTSGASGAGVIATVLGGGTNENLILTPKGTGGVVFPNGAVSTLAIRGSDTDSGIYFSGNNTRIVVDGTDAIATAGGGTALRIADSWSFTNSGVTGTPDAGMARVTTGVIRLTNSTGASQLLIGTSTDTADAQLSVYSQSTTRPSLKLRALSGTATTQNVFESYDAGGSLTASILAEGTIRGRAFKSNSDGLYILDDGNAVLKMGNNWEIQFSGGSAGSVADLGMRRATPKVLSLTDAAGAGGTLRAVPDSPTQLTADQNNYQAGTGRSLFYRLSTDASRTITGFNPAGGTNQNGELHYLINVGSNNIVLANESASSTAANRFTTNTGSDITLAANEMAMIVYDNTSARWRAVKL